MDFSYYSDKINSELEIYVTFNSYIVHITYKHNNVLKTFEPCLTENINLESIVQLITIKTLNLFQSFNAPISNKLNHIMKIMRIIIKTKENTSKEIYRELIFDLYFYKEKWKQYLQRHTQEQGIEQLLLTYLIYHWVIILYQRKYGESFQEPRFYESKDSSEEKRNEDQERK